MLHHKTGIEGWIPTPRFITVNTFLSTKVDKVEIKDFKEKKTAPLPPPPPIIPVQKPSTPGKLDITDEEQKKDINSQLKKIMIIFRLNYLSEKTLVSLT